MSNGDDKTMIMAPPGKSAPPPKCQMVCIDITVLEGETGKRVDLDDKELSFGRGDDNEVVLKAQGISRVHARVYPGDGVWGVEDLGSTNGVFVNKSRVKQAWMNLGDIVSIGHVHYKFTLADTEVAIQAAPSHNLDLGETEKTVVIRPGVKKAQAEAQAVANAEPEPEPEAATTPAPRAAARPAAPRPSRPAAAPAQSGSNMGLIVIIVVVVAVVAVGGFLALS
jgi:hypothetical protein